MIEKYKGTGRKKPYLIFTLTDETFSLVCSVDLPENVERKRYYFFVSLFDQIYWVAGSTPAPVVYLSNVLPYAIMGMLVVYCLKSTPVLESPHGLPELTSVALVVALHKWKHNTLLSIVSGTVAYMLLIQLVFA